MMYKSLVQLMRPKHYLKNALIFLPLMFSGLFFDERLLTRSFLAFIAFSLVASAVYIVNDIKDRKLDALHPKKKHRPIASRAVTVPVAATFAVSLLIIAGIVQYYLDFSIIGVSLIVGYLLINTLYSFGLKNIPIADVVILSLGFIIRVFYGGDVIHVHISSWLYLAILAFSFYLGLGKRRNEIRMNGTKTRKVNKYYNQEFLDKNMYVCLGLTIVYYSLWAIDPAQPHKLMYITIPLVIVIAMAYSLTVEGSASDGDPVSVLLGNKALLALVGLYAVLAAALVYIKV